MIIHREAEIVNRK